MSDPSIENRATELLEAELLICLGTIESLKDDSIRQSAKFWKAVETKLKIQRELKKRKS